MSKKRLLLTDALLDGITGTVGIPSVAAVSYRLPSKYRRGQSDVEKSWTFVGKYLEVAMQEYERRTEFNLGSNRADHRA